MKKKVKKAAIGVLASVMMLSIGGISAFASGSEARRNFADTNNDGVCDNYATGGSSQNESGKNFVDDDNEGVCDNYATRRGRGFRNGRNKQ